VLEDAQSALPRLSLDRIGSQECAELLELRGFVIVTGLGPRLERALADLAQLMKCFFEKAAVEVKEASTGSVYCNERGMPMYSLGYEFQKGVREAFRVAPAQFDETGWPDEELRAAWRSALTPLRKIADAALAAALRSGPLKRRDDDDHSIAYAFHYPNTPAFGGAHCNDASVLVAEHADPSLVVVEPVSEVAGLEVYDPVGKVWVSVEARCHAGTELVLFAGKALHAATAGRVPACRHRVVKPNPAKPRHSIIYEQKYAEFFEAGQYSW